MINVLSVNLLFCCFCWSNTSQCFHVIDLLRWRNVNMKQFLGNRVASSHKLESWGFRPECGTVDRLLTLVRVLEGAWEFTWPVHMCVVDLEKAVFQGHPGGGGSHLIHQYSQMTNEPNTCKSVQIYGMKHLWSLASALPCGLFVLLAWPPFVLHSCCWIHCGEFPHCPVNLADSSLLVSFPPCVIPPSERWSRLLAPRSRPHHVHRRNHRQLVPVQTTASMWTLTPHRSCPRTVELISLSAPTVMPLRPRASLRKVKDVLCVFPTLPLMISTHEGHTWSPLNWLTGMMNFPNTRWSLHAETR